MLITQFVSICLLVIDFGVSADSSLTKDVLKPTKNSDLRGSKKSRRALSSVGFLCTFDLSIFIACQIDDFINFHSFLPQIIIIGLSG